LVSSRVKHRKKKQQRRGGKRALGVLKGKNWRMPWVLVFEPTANGKIYGIKTKKNILKGGMNGHNYPRDRLQRRDTQGTISQL